MSEHAALLAENAALKAAARDRRNQMAAERRRHKQEIAELMAANGRLMKRVAEVLREQEVAR